MKLSDRGGRGIRLLVSNFSLAGEVGDGPEGSSIWLGALFFLVHGLCWTLVPVLVLAAGMLRFWEHRLSSVPPGESSP